MKKTHKRRTQISIDEIFFGPANDSDPANASNWTEEQFDRAMTFPSMDAAAGKFGISKALLQFAKNEGCDAFHASGRVNMGKFFRWFFPWAMMASLRNLCEGIEHGKSLPPGNEG